MFQSGGKRFQLFRLFRIPVYAEMSVGILIVLFMVLSSDGTPQGTARGLLYGVIAFVSIVWHEFGHALAIRKLGYGDSVIVLHGMGGVTQWRGNANRRDRILIALAGPGAGLLLGGAIYLIAVLSGPFSSRFIVDLIGISLFVNIGWSLFNLLPIWPMDGGHVLRYALASPKRPQRETLRLSLLVSMIAAGAVIVLAAVWQAIFVVVLLGFILYSNFQAYQQVKGSAPRGGGSTWGY